MAKSKAPLLIGAGVGVGLLALLAGKAKASDMGTSGKKTTPGKLTKELAALATKWANTFGAPPSLLIALMGIETNYRPELVNRNERAMKGGGAWGLTQLLLTSAQDLTKRYPAIAKKYWPQWDGTGKGLLDPNTHLAIAAFKLSNNWKRYKAKPNNWLTTGIAWHQGTGNIDKQIKAGNGRLIPAKLPPFGKEYYSRLEKQLATNQVVSTMLAMERQSGQFAYA